MDVHAVFRQCEMEHIYQLLLRSVKDSRENVIFEHRKSHCKNERNGREDGCWRRRIYVFPSDN